MSKRVEHLHGAHGVTYICQLLIARDLENLVYICGQVQKAFFIPSEVPILLGVFDGVE